MPVNVFVSNALAGGIVGVLNLTTAVSIATLLFAGLGPQYFAAGVTSILIGIIICSASGAFASTLPAVVVTPRSGLAPVFGSMVSAIAVSMTSQSEAARFATVFAAVIVTSVLTGTILFMLGHFKWGRLVRFIPYPVMGGFFAGIGYVFVHGGLSVSIGEQLSLADISILANSRTLTLAGPAILFGLVLFTLQRRIRHWTVFPTVLVLTLAAFHATVNLAGIPPGTLAANGWISGIEAGDIVFPILEPDQFRHINWNVVFDQTGLMLTVAVLAAILLLLEVTGIEIVTRSEMNPNRELKVIGFTNAVSGTLGGFPGTHVAADTALSYVIGGRSRIMGLFLAGTAIVVLAAGTGLMNAIPMFVRGGLLIFLVVTA